MTFVWDDDKITQLLHLWNFERLSAYQCAEFLGCTRNAVIGKVRRLMLPRRTFVVNRKPRKPWRRPPKVRTMPTEGPGITFLSSSTNKTIEGLDMDHCRNIIGRDHGEPVYCGASQLTYLNPFGHEVHSPYCPIHHAINHQPDRGIYHGYRERRSYR